MIPIAITTCSAVVSGMPPSTNVVAGTAPGITITFTNRSHATATYIEFTYSSHGHPLQNMTAAGRFVSGTTVTRQFGIAGSISPGETPGTCSVKRVEYANGAWWVNPSASGP